MRSRTQVTDRPPDRNVRRLHAHSSRPGSRRCMSCRETEPAKTPSPIHPITSSVVQRQQPISRSDGAWSEQNGSGDWIIGPSGDRPLSGFPPGRLMTARRAPQEQPIALELKQPIVSAQRAQRALKQRKEPGHDVKALVFLRPGTAPSPTQTVMAVLVSSWRPRQPHCETIEQDTHQNRLRFCARYSDSRLFVRCLRSSLRISSQKPRKICRRCVAV